MKYQYFKNNYLEKAWILSSTRIFRNEELGFAEAVVQTCSVKKMLLKISQNLLENTGARASFK